MKDYYSILGVQPTATIEEISSAYKKRVKVVHPDRFDPKTQPDEWQQANRMLQELNEAYNYLKNNYSSSSYSYRQANNTSSSQDTNTSEKSSSYQKPYSNEDTSRSPFPARGITNCPIDKLKQKHIYFINSLINNKKEVVRLNRYGFILDYVGLITAGYFYGTNVESWGELNIVVTENYWLGVTLLLILGLLISYFGLAIYNYHKAKIKPCILLSPMYYIRVKHNQITFAYSWEIESFNFHKKNFLPYFNIKIGNYLDKFYVPITFSFNLFKKKLSKIDSLRSNVKDRLSWLTSNDILRDLKSWSIQKNRIPSIIGYSSSVILTVVVSIILANSFTIVDKSVPATAKLESYAAKEAQSPASEIPTAENIVVPPSPSKYSQQDPSKTFDKPPKQLPATGKEYYYSGGSGVARLEIVVPPNGDNYFVKVVNASNNENIKAVFVRSGDRVTIKVPLGTYKIKYATGKTWYGKEYLFGPDTRVTMAESDFDFRREGNQVTGYSIELIKQINGNLRSHDISLEQF